MAKYRLFIAILMVFALMPGMAYADVNDVNGDGQVNIADAVYIFAYLFVGGPPPPGGNIWVMDANGDGCINIADGMAILAFLF